MTRGRARRLSARALGRATLARQLLLDRAALRPIAAVEQLVGMQAQIPLNPYLGLWSRLDRFDPHELGGLVESRAVVRIALMRDTIHLVSARDCRSLRPLVQPMLDRSLRGNAFGRAVEGIDPAALADAGRALLDERPRTLAELRPELAERFPGRDPAGLAQAVRTFVPLVQVPPRGVWGGSGGVRLAAAESWLGRPLDPDPSLDDMVLRYLAAYGPATAADVRAWCGLAGMRDVLERLRPRLEAFRDERGRELFDVPGAPLPDAEAPAPPRFLPEYDNLLLSHADRGRVMDDTRPRPLVGVPTVLVDGRVAATWRLHGGELRVTPLRLLTPAERDAVVEEGERLLAFLAAAEDRHVVAFAGAVG